MKHNETQNIELEAGEETPNAGGISIKRNGIKKAALFAIPIGAFVLGAYFLKEKIGESLVGAYLRSNNIDSDLKISDIGIDGAKIDVLSLKSNNETTLLLKSGTIRWHFDKSLNPHIDLLDAASLNLNLAYSKKSGFDFGALEGFLKPSGKKSNLTINAVTIDELNLNLKTDYGKIDGTGNLNGSFNHGLKGEIDFTFPNSIANPNSKIRHNFATNAINSGGDFIIGNEIVLTNFSTSETLSKDIALEGLNGSLVFAIIAPNANNAGARLKFLNSQLQAKKFKSNSYGAGDFIAKIENGWLNLGKNPLEEAVFDFAGLVSGQNANLNGNTFDDFNIDFELARAKEGNLRLIFESALKDVNSPISASGVKANGVFDFLIKDFSQLSDAIGNGYLNTFLLKADGKIIKEVKAKFEGTGFENIFERPNINTHLTWSLDKDNLILSPKNGIILENSSSRLELLLAKTSQILLSRSNNQIDAFASGNIIAKAPAKTDLAAKINAFNYENGNLIADITDLKANNFKRGNYKFDLGSLSGKIQMADSEIVKADFAGLVSANDNNLMLNGKFKGKIDNNYLNFSANGNSKSLAFGEIIANDTIFTLNAKGDFKTKLNFDGNLDAAKVGSKLFAAYKANGDFGGTYDTKNMTSALNAHLDVARFVSDTLSMSQAKLETDGILRPRKPLRFAGQLDGKIEKMRINEDEMSDANIRGPFQFTQNGNNIFVNSNACLSIDFEEYVANSLALKSSNMKICPDSQSRLFALYNNKTSLYGTALIENASLSMGRGDDATKIVLNDFNGHFVPSKNNAISFSGKSNNLELQFMTAPQKPASIESKNATFELVNTPQGTQIFANLGELSSKGLPVNIKGSANGRFKANELGFSGAFNINDVLISDIEKVKRFENFLVSGQGEILDNKVNIYGDAMLQANSINAAQIFFNHDLDTQTGGVLIDAPALEFGRPLQAYNNQILQAKDIIPAISAIFGRSYGNLSASAKFEWAPQKPLISNANINTKGLSFESSWGNLFDINGEIVIDDLLGFKTSETQNLKIGSFDVGIPIENGEIGFSLNGTDSIMIDNAHWPFADGVLSIVPTKIDYGNPDLQFAVNVKSIDMVKFLKLAKIPNIEIEGTLSGVLPVYLVDNSFEIRGGILKADSGGVLRYTGPSPIAEAPKAQGIQKLRNQVFGEPPPPPAELAFKALRDLRYKILEMRVDGRTTGDATISILLEGYNPELIGGQGFRFNIKLALPLNSIISSFNNFKKTPSQFINDYKN